MVLVKGIERLDKAPADPTSLAGCRLQREDGGGYDQLAR